MTMPITPNIRLCIRDLGEIVRFSFRPLDGDEPEELLASVRKSAIEFWRDENPLFDELRDAFTKLTVLVAAKASGCSTKDVKVTIWPGSDRKEPES